MIDLKPRDKVLLAAGSKGEAAKDLAEWKVAEVLFILSDESGHVLTYSYRDIEDQIKSRELRRSDRSAVAR